MESKDILGLDVGIKHTGIARASNVARLAEPLLSVATADVLDKLNEYAQAHKVEAIAVGLPRNLSGEDTEQTTWARAWVDEAKKKVSLPLYWQDEALTSIKAEDLKLGAKSKLDEHAVAAAIILQDFLDASEAERVLA